MEREVALKHIICWDSYKSESFAAIKNYKFDSDVELVKVTSTDLLAILKRFESGEVKTNDVIDWANFIECRDDVDYSEIENQIYILANPSLQQLSIKELAKNIISGHHAI